MKAINIILILLILTSCRNTKEVVKTESEVKTSTEQTTTRNEDKKADTKTVSTINKNVSEYDTTYIIEYITDFSKPDESGKQYTEKITERVISTGKNKETKTAIKEEVNQAVENKVVQTENKDIEQKVNTETEKTAVKKSNSWKVILIIILVLSVAGWMVYKFKGGWIKNIVKKISQWKS